MLGHKATTINNYMKNINWKSVLDIFQFGFRDKKYWRDSSNEAKYV